MTAPPVSGAPPAPGAPKKKINMSNAWQEARELIWAHRWKVALGFVVVLINSAASFVLPSSTKFLIDNVIGKHRPDLLKWMALAIAGATVVQAITSFTLSQVLGVAAQRAITDMRNDVEAHVLRLPIAYFDSTKSGVLISRIMTDAEGIRNLVGTGLVQLVGGIVTAVIALGVLFYLNWRLTVAHAGHPPDVRRRDGVRLQAAAAALPRARPDQRRGDRPARRSARRRPHREVVRRREAARRVVFTRGAHQLFRNVAQSITGVSAIARVLDGDRRRDRRADDHRSAARDPGTAR